LLVLFGVARRRRTCRPALPEGQIATKNAYTGYRKPIRKSYQQRSIAIASRSVSQDEKIDIRLCCGMQKSANRSFSRSVVDKRLLEYSHDS
jgi:hypothetical protein